MDDFFNELDSELGDKKGSGDSKPGAKPVKKAPPVPAGARRAGARPSTRKATPRPAKKPTSAAGKPLQLKRSAPAAGKPASKLTLKNGAKPSSARIKEIDKEPRAYLSLNSKRIKSISSPTVFPKMVEPYSLPPLEKGKTRIVPIGGLKTVGNNMNMIQHGNDILLVDGGLEFAKDDTPGADYILPDIRALIPHKDKIVGMFITHGHLDHIGALKNIIPALGFPKVYGSPFTIAMIKKIFEEAGIKQKTRFVTVDPDAAKIGVLGNFKYEFFRVNHTIPDSCGIYIETSNTRIMHMGDYKIDFSPRIDKPTSLANYARIASRGIDILMQETTNSYRAEWTTTEAHISGELDALIQKAAGRVIVGNFSTLISRIQDIVTIAEKYGRYIFINGRSMVNHVAIAREMGYLKSKTNTIKNLDRKTLADIPEHQQLIITTGAQGEPYGGLNIMSRGEHKAVSIKPRDTIILSSSVIPGNEVPIIEMKNRLHRFGPTLITIKEFEVHSGGHGGIAEQRVIMNLVKPRYIIPVHGDLSQRLTLKKEAVKMGFDVKQILMVEDGAILDIDSKREVVNTRKKLPVEVLFVDGQGMGSKATHIIKDRIAMRDAGVLILTFTGKKVAIESRGLFHPDEVREAHKALITKGQEVYEKASKGASDAKNVVKVIRSDLEKFVLKKWDREPMVVPIVI